MPEDLPAPTTETELDAVDLLSACLPRVLSELSATDRDAIQLCEIEGLTHQAFAQRFGLSLAAAKSRIQRARLRLRTQLANACKVRFDTEGKVCCHTPRPPLEQGKPER